MSKAEEWAARVNAAEVEMQDATKRFQAACPTDAPLQLTLGPNESDYGTRLVRIGGVPYLEHTGTLGAANALALARWIQEWFA